ncbi:MULTISPECIES: hypothetical protein [unclassified Streptomyces]|uniref:hypothetical protein n=1 Tax=unclassified Streptomyces TaxID=2593676 RepID=UPI00332F35A8
MSFALELHKCAKPDCTRQVKAGAVHCCADCATAAAGRYEVHEHSTGCEQRHAMRGPWPLGWHYRGVTAQSVPVHSDPPPFHGPVRGPGRNESGRAVSNRIDPAPYVTGRGPAV